MRRYTSGWLFAPTPLTGVDIAMQCIKLLRRAVKASTYVLDAAEANALARSPTARRGSRAGASSWHAVPVPRVRARLARPDMLALLVQVC